MNINIQTVHFKGSEDLKVFVLEKVGKLFDQNPAIMHADVTLAEGASGNPENKWCEIILAIPGDSHVVKKNTDMYEKSVAEAVEALRKIMRRKKEITVTDRRH